MKKLKKYLFSLILLAMLVCTPVHAEETNNYDVQDFYWDTANNLIFNHNVFGSSVVAGNSVDISGNVDGILVGAGNALNDKGTSEYAVLAGNTIDVAGSHQKDVLIAGNSITVRNNAKFGRDLFVFGSMVDLSGTVTRNVTIYADIVNVDEANINGNVKIYANAITVGDEVTIKGSLSYTSDNLQVSKVAQIGSLEKIQIEDNYSYFNELSNKIISYVSLLLVFAVLALTIPKVFEKTKKCEFSFMKILTLSGDGLLLLVLVPIAIVLLLTIVIGAPLALIILALYLIMLYLSNAFAGYYLGKYIWTKFIKKEDNILLEALIGITILFILYLIPFVGVITSMLSFLAGLGLIVLTIKKK